MTPSRRARPSPSPAVPRAAAERAPDALARSVAADILGGSHPVGSLLPDDAALAAGLGAGVAATRAALRQLETLGLVVRGRGGAVQVVSGEVRALYEMQAGASGSVYLGETQVIVERRRRVAADAELAVLLGVREGSEWLCLSGVRVPADASFGALSCVDAWLGGNAEVVPGIKDFSPDRLEALLGTAIAEVQEEVFAAPLTPAQARLLRTRGGSGALHIARRYLGRGGTLLAAVRDVHPSGRVTVTLRSRRG
jgi:GntR family transcriptional regulator